MKSFDEAMTEAASEYLRAVIRESHGNISEAARRAKRNRTAFYKLLVKYGVEIPADAPRPRSGRSGNWASFGL